MDRPIIVLNSKGRLIPDYNIVSELGRYRQGEAAKQLRVIADWIENTDFDDDDDEEVIAYHG